jgi:hypothetical protein
MRVRLSSALPAHAAEKTGTVDILIMHSLRTGLGSMHYEIYARPKTVTLRNISDPTKNVTQFVV